MSANRAAVDSLPPALNAGDAQRSVYGWDAAYRDVADTWTPWLNDMAKRIIGSAVVRQELVQEALVRLWELDPARFDESDRAAVEKELVKRMRQCARTERRRYGRKRRVEWARAAAEKPLLGLLEEMDECG